MLALICLFASIGTVMFDLPCRFQKGRLRHSKGDAHGAWADYTTSLQCDQTHLYAVKVSSSLNSMLAVFCAFRAARFCVAQTSLLLGNVKDAEKHLQVRLLL